MDPFVNCRRVPSIVSTLPLIPDGALGVLTGGATCAPDFALSTAHLVPNSFFALPISRVAVGRSRVTSSRLRALLLEGVHHTLRFEDDARTPLQRRQRRVLPVRARAAEPPLTAFCSPDWFAIRPNCGVSFVFDDTPPSFFSPLCEIGP